MQLNDKIFVAGHRGLVGSALLRCLQVKGYTNLVYRTRNELDLTQQAAVDEFFSEEQPDFVFLAAAMVGGIHANNSYRGDFIYRNLILQSNVIHAAHQQGVKRLLFLGSSCIYPRDCPQPIKEEYLLTGPLESTNEPYAVAKIAGLKMCEAYNTQFGTSFLSVMPTNLYGQNDNYNIENAHVIPALMRKIHEAKIFNQPKVTVWGSGSPLREFLSVDDLAEACVFILNQDQKAPPMLNVGSGEEVSIRELANLLKRIVGYEGGLEFDPRKPDGTPRKLLDSSRLASLGWDSNTNLQEGLQDTYRWFEQNYEILCPKFGQAAK